MLFPSRRSRQRTSGDTFERRAPAEVIRLRFVVAILEADKSALRFQVTQKRNLRRDIGWPSSFDIVSCGRQDAALVQAYHALALAGLFISLVNLETSQIGSAGEFRTPLGDAGLRFGDRGVTPFFAYRKIDSQADLGGEVPRGSVAHDAVVSHEAFDIGIMLPASKGESGLFRGK